MPEPATVRGARPSVDGQRFARGVAATLVGGTVAVGVIAIVATVWHLRRLSGAVLWNSDAVAPSLLADSLMKDGLTSSQTILGDITSLQDLLLFMAVGWLPHHESIWRVLPYATFLLGAACLALAVRTATGTRISGWLTLALLAAASLPVQFSQIAPAFRGGTWALLGITSVVLVRSFPPDSEPQAMGRGLLALMLCLVTVGLASDPLVAVVLLGPLAVLALLVRAHGAGTTLARQLAWLALAPIAAAALLLAALSRLHVESARSHRGESLASFASWPAVERHVSQLWRNLLALTGAADGAAVPTHWWGAIPVALAIVCLAQLALAVARRGVLTSRPEGEAALLVFWAAGSALLVAAYVVSSGPNPDVPGPQNARYLVPLWMAVAVAAPILWRLTGGFRAAAAGLGFAVLVAPGAISVIGLQLAHQREHSPIAGQARDVAAFVRQSGAGAGFAGYWDALPLDARADIPVVAVDFCASPRPHLCPHEVNTRLGWYGQPAAPRVAVILNSRPSTGFTAADVERVPGLGAPIARRSIGTMTVLIFDVAATASAVVGQARDGS